MKYRKKSLPRGNREARTEMMMLSRGRPGTKPLCEEESKTTRACSGSHRTASLNAGA